MSNSAAPLLLLVAVAACGGNASAPADPGDGIAACPSTSPSTSASTAPSPPRTGSPSANVLADAPMRAALAAVEKTPYTAEQIRAATRPGRTYTWAVQLADGPAVRRVIRFTAVDEERATFVAETADADGKNPKADPPEQATWEELRQHAEFPRMFVTVSEEKVEVPAGTFDCLVYTVKAATRDGAEEKLTFWFAKELPGPPVKLVVTRDGKLARSQVLSAYAPGR